MTTLPTANRSTRAVAISRDIHAYLAWRAHRSTSAYLRGTPTWVWQAAAPGHRSG